MPNRGVWGFFSRVTDNQILVSTAMGAMVSIVMLLFEAASRGAYSPSSVLLSYTICVTCIATFWHVFRAIGGRVVARRARELATARVIKRP